MKDPAVSHSLTGKYVLYTAIAVFTSFFFHELAHWAMGEALGYKMGMTLNTAFALNGVNTEREATLIDAAGPIFTILQAFVFYLVLLNKKDILYYPFLFTPLYQRVLAGVMNIFNLNDEGHISRYLGIGTFTLSILVCSLIGVMIYHIYSKQLFSKRIQLITFFLVMVFSSILILSNQFFNIRLI
ncbi:MAG: hypothetical protein WKF35_02185 [Ferruginibacter sp.]